MLEWFKTLTLPEQILWLIAILATVLFFFVLIGRLFKNNSHRHFRYGLYFFKFRNCIAFFSIFGWVGIASLNQGYGLTTSVIIAFISGLFMMGIMTALSYYINKMRESGALEYKNALNSTGEVYMEIGKQRTKIGKVQINVLGTLREMDAVTDFDHDIQKGTLIRVESVTPNGLLIIKPLQ